MNKNLAVVHRHRKVLLLDYYDIAYSRIAVDHIKMQIYNVSKKIDHEFKLN